MIDIEKIFALQDILDAYIWHFCEVWRKLLQNKNSLLLTMYTNQSSQNLAYSFSNIDYLIGPLDMWLLF